MLRTLHRRSLATLAGLLLAAFGAPGGAAAHCDTMDGPVVKAAQDALATGNVNLVLIWVKPSDEAEVRTAFSRTTRARATNDEVRELADMYFFETVVRLHRAGEGAPYTGLKPAGSDLGPVVPAADRAIATGSLEELEGVLVHAIRDGLRAHFQEVVRLKDFGPGDVDAGRRYVAAYVPFVHYAEGIHQAASMADHGQHPEPLTGTEPAHHKH